VFITLDNKNVYLNEIRMKNVNPDKILIGNQLETLAHPLRGGLTIHTKNAYSILEVKSL
jgi:hypothetical protein